MQSKSFIPSSNITDRWFWLVAIIWTVIITGSLFWGLYVKEEEIDHFVGAEANAMIDDIIIFRSWNALHGGVYVEVNDRSKPNEYLKGLVQERDITPPSGKKLTLINPAYMTRQMNELLAKKLGRLAHITSLKPIRPANAPDDWERRALESIETGAEEVQELTSIRGQPYMRVMRPLFTAKSCLKCHAQQGYKEGDIRGGISASIPMQEHLAVSNSNQLSIALMHLFIWLFGVVGLKVSRNRLNASQLKNRQAELALIENERRYRSFYEHSPLGYMSMDSAGFLIESNPTLCQMLGYDKGEMIGKLFSDFLTPDSARRFTSFFALFKEEGHVRDIFFDMKGKDASVISVSIDGRVANDANGEFKQTHCMVADISMRKIAEDKIKKLSLAIEQASEAIEITDKDGTIEYVNPAFTTITGYTEQELIGQNPRIFKSGEQDEQFYQDMWARLTSGQAWQGRVIDKKQDGTLYPAMLTISPIVDEAGEITHYVGIQQSLKEYEDLEEQFYQSQKMEAIGTLVGGIAHDFNNTLAGITGNLYLAKAASSHNPNVIEKLERVERLSFRAADMIQQLLTFSRKGIVQMRALSISAFLQDVIKLHRASVPEDIDFDFVALENSMVIYGDVNQLQQILMNLISNARDAVYEVENPKIYITLSKKRMHAQLLEKYPDAIDEEYACISVVDNGYGISDTKLQHIFEPFFTTKEVGKGTGLGLSMVYGAVQTHAGFIDVVNSDGSTEFNLYFPLLEAGTPVDQKRVVEGLVKGDGECILLVDDDETVLSTGKEVLEKLNYKVLTAIDGQMASERYARQGSDIDLLIFDVVMPKMGGVEALEAIRKIEPNVKIIFATGYDKLSRLKSREVDLSLEVVLKKPFSISELAAAIRQKLDN